MEDFTSKLWAEKERINDLLEEAQLELMRLLDERSNLEGKIVRLQLDIKHMAAICGTTIEDPHKQLGVTGMIRWVLADNDGPLTIAEVENKLKTDFTFDPKDYKNSRSMIQTVVTRLIKAGDVEQNDRLVANRQKAFQWIAKYKPDMPWERWAEESEIEELREELDK